MDLRFEVEGARWRAFDGSRLAGEAWTVRRPDGKRFVAFGEETEAAVALVRHVERGLDRADIRSGRAGGAWAGWRSWCTGPSPRVQ